MKIKELLVATIAVAALSSSVYGADNSAKNLDKTNYSNHYSQIKSQKNSQQSVDSVQTPRVDYIDSLYAPDPNAG